MILNFELAGKLGDRCHTKNGTCNFWDHIVPSIHDLSSTEGHFKHCDCHTEIAETVFVSQWLQHANFWKIFSIHIHDLVATEKENLHVTRVTYRFQMLDSAKLLPYRSISNVNHNIWNPLNLVHNCISSKWGRKWHAYHASRECSEPTGATEVNSLIDYGIITGFK